MATITREQVEAQIKQYENAYRAGEPDDGSWDMDYTRAYIAQLEANQRHPITDEKLMEAVEYLRNALSYRPEVGEQFNFEGAAHLTTVLDAVENKRMSLADAVVKLETDSLANADAMLATFADHHNPYEPIDHSMMEVIPTLRAALSELEALRDASKWHPMDTAPKDGSYFMAWFEGAELPTDLCWNNGRWEDMEMREENHEGFFSDAFVWMPLPTPPAQEV